MKRIRRVQKTAFLNRSSLSLILSAAAAVLMFSTIISLAKPNGTAGDLYVTSSSTDAVIRYDGTTGQPIGVFAHVGIHGPTDLAFGPHGDLFVVNWSANTVTQHNGNTGAFIRVFASSGMNFPNSLVFTPWGTLIVSNQAGATIREFDSKTGAFLRVFASGVGVGVSGLAIGPNGNLFVSDVFSGNVRQYLPDGTFVGIFAQGNGLEYPEGLTFGPRGNLFVASDGNSSVYEFDGTTGSFIKQITRFQGGLNCPVGLAFDPYNGHLMASNWAQAEGTTISEIDTKNSSLVGTISGGGLLAPFGMKYKPGRIQRIRPR